MTNNSKRELLRYKPQHLKVGKAQKGLILHHLWRPPAIIVSWQQGKCLEVVWNRLLDKIIG